MTDRVLAEHERYVIQLAEEQTKLARERTTRSHIRTGFASFLFGTAIFGLFGEVLTNIVGGVFIFVGVIFLATGWVSYVKSNQRTRQLLEEFEEPFRRH